MSVPVPPRAEIVVDVAAIRHNVRTLAALVAADGADVAMMTVVKADGYGHGLVEVARAAREGGATWLGVATPEEALALRAGGDDGPVLCWLSAPGDDLAPLIRSGIDVAAYGVVELDAVVAAAERSVARVHLKVDTGLGRGGAHRSQWDELFAHAARLERDGRVRIVGIWSHLASSDDPDHPANDEQEAAFRDALADADAAGLRPEVRHLANSAAAVLRPSSRFDLVRCGIASYGLDPAPGHAPDVGLVPAMTVRARAVMVKRVEAGAGVSYGHTWHAPTATRLALVPVGYADGIPRSASNRGEVWAGGGRRPVRGTICMDQFVVDLGDRSDDRPNEQDGGETFAAGDEVVLFGPGADGEPTAQDWAQAAGTISYEIVTGVGGRMVRSHRDSRIDQQVGETSR